MKCIKELFSEIEARKRGVNLAVWKRVPELGVFEDLFEACDAIGRVEWLEEKSHMSQVKITPLPGTEPFVKGKKNQFVVWYKDDEECAE